MAEDQNSAILLFIVAIVAVVGLGLAVASFTTHTSFGGMMSGGSGGGGMMGGDGNSSGTTSPAPGTTEWAVLGVSAFFFVAAVALILHRGSWSRGREAAREPEAAPVGAPAVPAVAPAAVEPATSSPPATAATPPPAAPIPEPSLVKLLDEDERRMYLEIRGHHGEMLQRDLVALGTFSKAKVTRVLDKLEAKGVVVRERHGMTNRVRIVNGTK